MQNELTPTPRIEYLCTAAWRTRQFLRGGVGGLRIRAQPIRMLERLAERKLAMGEHTPPCGEALCISKRGA